MTEAPDSLASLALLSLAPESIVNEWLLLQFDPCTVFTQNRPAEYNFWHATLFRSLLK